jgi:hypothetical protein
MSHITTYVRARVFRIEPCYSGVDTRFAFAAAAKQGGGPGAVTEQLAAFENGSYNLEARLAGLSEKGVSRLRSELGHLEAEASDGVRRAVHQHYTHYIKASQVRGCVPYSIIFRWSRLGVPGIGELEGEIQTLRGVTSCKGRVLAGVLGVGNLEVRIRPLGKLVECD